MPEAICGHAYLGIKFILFKNRHIIIFINSQVIPQCEKYAVGICRSKLFIHDIHTGIVSSLITFSVYLIINIFL